MKIASNKRSTWQPVPKNTGDYLQSVMESVILWVSHFSFATLTPTSVFTIYIFLNIPTYFSYLVHGGDRMLNVNIKSEKDTLKQQKAYLGSQFQKIWSIVLSSIASEPLGDWTSWQWKHDLEEAGNKTGTRNQVSFKTHPCFLHISILQPVTAP